MIKQTTSGFHLNVLLLWLGITALLVLALAHFDLKFSFMAEKFPILLGLKLSPSGFLQGAVLTVFMCAIAIVASSLLGLLAALGRLSCHALPYAVATYYTSFFRGTPLLVQICLIYLGLPQLGPVPDAIPSGLIALSLNYGAYLSEVFRAALLAVPHGQKEAAQALGLPRLLVFWKILLPQALRIALPPTGTQFIAMLKDSSLISVMGVWELMFLAQSYGRASYRYLEMLLCAALIYWLLSLAFELTQATLEKRFGRGFKN